MKNSIAVFGGGIAGLTAAHELAERGFKVTVYEPRRIFGGKARSMPVPGSGRGGRKPLPAEHGFRLFPGFYRHVPNTMERIPYGSNPEGVLGNLVSVDRTLFASAGQRALRFPVHAPRSRTDLASWAAAFVDATEAWVSPADSRSGDEYRRFQGRAPSRTSEGVMIRVTRNGRANTLAGRGSSVRPLQVLLRDQGIDRRRRVEGLLSSIPGADVRAPDESRARPGVAVVAIDGEDSPPPGSVLAATLSFIRELRQRGVPVVCYASGSASWPLSSRCQVLLAGAPTLLDSSRMSFESELRTEVQNRLEAAVQTMAADRRLDMAVRDLGIVGDGPALREALRGIERCAGMTDMPVLILGESGTGKELLARAVHRLDERRKDKPFVAVNCAALTKTLAESELFGHRKGVFSGADRDRVGLVRAAAGGVLFLDELGELDLELQTKLLRVIQERSVLVLGDSRETPVDVRIVAATHRDLKAMVRQNRFRADLLNRLWVYPIEVPPLRHRREDIPTFVQFFVSRYARSDRAPPIVTPDFLAALQLVKLEGNVRQLANIVQRAVALAEENGSLGLAELPADLWTELTSQDAPPSQADGDGLLPPSVSGDFNLLRSIARHERALVETAMRASGGNQSRAARLLGITARSMYSKLRKHKLVGESCARDST